MNMGLARIEWQEKLERLHRESCHDDGCATMFPGGVCDCTQRAIRTGSPYPEIPMGGAMSVPQEKP
jgi:hypothetical protein